MQFTKAFSTLVVILPLLALEVTGVAVPMGSANLLAARNRHNFHHNNNKGKASQSVSSAAAPAATLATVTASNATAVSNATATAGAVSSSNVNATIGTLNNPNEQDSLNLDPTQIGSNLASDGQAVQEAGQVPSLTSVNNFMNFCLTQQGVPITNGLQTIGGSCNPIPMGRIIAKDLMPSSKFTNPVNGQTIKANTDFTISIAMKNFGTGNFVNANTNYFGAPCQVDGGGIVQGHSHVVVEKINGLADTQATDPTVFQFFKGLNAQAVGGILTADVTAGLPAGTYRVSTINTCANHQPVLVAVAQHGSLDDQVYFTVQ